MNLWSLLICTSKENANSKQKNYRSPTFIRHSSIIVGIIELVSNRRRQSLLTTEGLSIKNLWLIHLSFVSMPRLPISIWIPWSKFDTTEPATFHDTDGSSVPSYLQVIVYDAALETISAARAFKAAIVDVSVQACQNLIPKCNQSWNDILFFCLWTGLKIKLGK